jgi:hypothetical protein
MNAFVWRIEHQQRGLPHGHILFWTDFDTADLSQVERVINARLPPHSPVENDEKLLKDHRKLLPPIRFTNTRPVAVCTLVLVVVATDTRRRYLRGRKWKDVTIFSKEVKMM